MIKTMKASMTNQINPPELQSLTDRRVQPLSKREMDLVQGGGGSSEAVAEYIFAFAGNLFSQPGGHQSSRRMSS